MQHFWQQPEFVTLKKELGDARLAGVIVNHDCKTFAEFCEKFDTLEMMRLPNFGKGSMDKVRAYAEKASVPIREGVKLVPPVPARTARVSEPIDNDIFLHCTPAFPESVCLAIGARHNKRSTTLSTDDTLKLAYRLMALARGGETQGFEKFERS